MGIVSGIVFSYLVFIICLAHFFIAGFKMLDIVLDELFASYCQALCSFILPFM